MVNRYITPTTTAAISGSVAITPAITQRTAMIGLVDAASIVGFFQENPATVNSKTAMNV